ncbi:hypothetical protein [Agrobacterium pusense]|uniref:hypothetical protein n=1 Tax=Agrobacterium pusense TaxID=648995 RepID=UPI0005141AC5|nr:hypothetical protein [Agrobacterium pusense]ANV25616.1 hypothetical protein BA939_16465 [Rhizobium sp. S41]KGE80209.1 hypothetical protein LW14_24480 [Rhizobium sp. H41]QWW77738.1 hypothetical protein KP800_26600 [Agrobacterium pusense]
MSATETREYRVFLHTWDVYDVIIGATSPEDAVAKAQALYDATGCEAFNHHASGCDGLHYEEGL